MSPEGGPSPTPPRVAHWLAALSRLGFLILVAFHAWLLLVRALEGQLLDPGVALRWAGGGALLAALVALRRLGLPLLHGRKAAVLWTLVFLLHCHAVVAPPLTPSGRPIVPQAAEVVSPFTVSPLLLVVGALLLALAFGRRHHALRVCWRGPDVAGAIGAPAVAHLACLAPRPPPPSAPLSLFV